MAVDVTISHPGLNGPHEARVFTGNAEDLLEFGVDHIQTVGGGPETRRYVRGSMIVKRGDVFVRPVRIESGETLEEDGGWTWFGNQGALLGSLRWRALAAIVSAPGSPMRDPVGSPLFDQATGVRLTTPASGEQARDPWTGALLFNTDPEGNQVPILVP